MNSPSLMFGGIPQETRGEKRIGRRERGKNRIGEEMQRMSMGYGGEDALCRGDICRQGCACGSVVDQNKL